MLFADDLAIVGEDIETLNDMLRKWLELFKQNGLKINVKKMEYLKIGEDGEYEEMNINCNPFRLPVNEFRVGVCM